MIASGTYLAYGAAAIRSGRPSLELGGYTELTSPLPESTVTGVVTLTARVDPALGATAVDFIVGLHTPGQPSSGYVSTTKSGNTYTGSWDSRLIQGVTATEDFHAGIRVRVTTPTGVRFTQPTFVFTGNVNLPGTTPVWKSSSEWEVDYSNLTAFLASFDSKWGADATTTAMVIDPVLTGQNGHINHGNVASVVIPNDYTGPQPNENRRWQVSSPPTNREGMMVWKGGSFRIDPNFQTPTFSHISVGQIMGDPFDQGLRLMLDARTMTSTTGYDFQKTNTWYVSPSDGGAGDPGPLFQMPFYRGQWVDVVYGVGFSRDIRKGWLEIWYRTPDTNGQLVPANLFGIPGLHRVPRVMLPANAVGERFDDHLYFAVDKFFPDVRAMFAKSKIGPTRDAVDPHSY